jgi:hypothetical protein
MTTLLIVLGALGVLAVVLVLSALCWAVGVLVESAEREP